MIISFCGDCSYVYIKSNACPFGKKKKKLALMKTLNQVSYLHIVQLCVFKIHSQAVFLLHINFPVTLLI